MHNAMPVARRAHDRSVCRGRFSKTYGSEMLELVGAAVGSAPRMLF